MEVLLFLIAESIRCFKVRILDSADRKGGFLLDNSCSGEIY
jgi:hypothetical protein